MKMELVRHRVVLALAISSVSSGAAFADFSAENATTKVAAADVSALALAGHGGGGGGGGGGSHGGGGGGGGGGSHSGGGGGGGFHPAPGGGGGGSHGGGGGGGGFHPAPGGGGGSHGGGGGGFHPAPGGGGHPSNPNPGHPGNPNPGHPGNPNPGHPGNPNPGHPGNPNPGHPGNPNPGHPGNPNPGHPGNPNPGHPGNPGHPFNPGHPAPGFTHDPHGNLVDPHNGDRIHQVNDRMNNVMRHDPRVTENVNRWSSVYRTDYRAHIVERGPECDRWIGEWRDRFSPWRSYGFCGGFWWAFHPYYDIDSYYWNPAIYWFYGSDWDDYYYQTWYGPDYDAYPQLHQPFPYVGVFFPTEEFRDLNLSVSGFPVLEQINYREAMRVLVQELQQQVTGTTLGANEVVIDHFQILPNDAGIVVEGFVGQDQSQFPFKALLDLRDPSQTQVFVPGMADGEPSGAQLAGLDALNERVVQLGGVVEVGDGGTSTVGDGSDNGGH
jgi:hypothetical protein